MKKRIHVNQYVCRANKNAGKNIAPPFTIKTYKDNTKGYAVEIEGKVKLVSAPGVPLSCGATIWIETEAPVAVLVKYGGKFVWKEVP